jgi:hypothetical protein
LKPDAIPIDHHHQPNSLLGTAPDVAGGILQACEDKGESPMGLAGLDADGTMEKPFEERPEEPLLFAILAQQGAPQLGRQATLRGR